MSTDRTIGRIARDNYPTLLVKGGFVLEVEHILGEGPNTTVAGTLHKDCAVTYDGFGPVFDSGDGGYPGSGEFYEMLRTGWTPFGSFLADKDDLSNILPLLDMVIPDEIRLHIAAVLPNGDVAAMISDKEGSVPNNSLPFFGYDRWLDLDTSEWGTPAEDLFYEGFTAYLTDRGVWLGEPISIEPVHVAQVFGGNTFCEGATA